MRITRKEQVALLGGTVVCLVAAAVGISNAAPAAKPRAVAAPTTWYQCVNSAGASESTKGGTAVPTCAHSVDRIISWPANVYTPPAPTTTTKPPGTTTTAHVTTSIFNPTTTIAPATTLPAPTTTVAPGADPSGAAMPVGNIPGWNQTCAEGFTKNTATGSWGTSDASKVVYTGDNSCKWTVYPDGWSSTNTNGGVGYCPKQVLSVHDSVLDFNLAPINGHACGANPSPLLGASQYQNYGMYSIRLRTDHVSGYHDALLLWPQNDGDWQSAESDFPEMDLTDATVSAYAHYGGSGSQDAFEGTKVDLTQYHTFTQVWSPGQRQYFVDGTLIGTSTHSVYSGPERYQMQVEPSGTAAGGTGHELIAWFVAYSRA